MSDVIARRAASRSRRRLVIGAVLFAAVAAPSAAAFLFARRVVNDWRAERPDRDAVGRPSATPPRDPAAAPARPRPPVPAPTGDARVFWRYASLTGATGGASFRRMPDGWWEETGRDGVAILGVWEEIGRTPEHVELYDARRNQTARLAAGRAWTLPGRGSNQLGGTPADGDWADKPSGEFAREPAPRADARTLWRFGTPYAGAHFRRLDDGRWKEVKSDTRTEMGVWDEVTRTPEYVELYDPKRNYSVRLGSARSWLAGGRGPTAAFGPSYAGDWADSATEPPLPVVKAGPPADPLRGIGQTPGGLDTRPDPAPAPSSPVAGATPPADPAATDKNGFLVPVAGAPAAKNKGKPKGAADKTEKRPPLGPKLDPLVDQLTGRVAKDRLKAAEQLGALGPAAAPAARYLCAAILDPVPAVSTAALQALETVMPELYTPLSTICVERQSQPRLDAITHIANMKEKGLPALTFLLGCLAADAVFKVSPAAIGHGSTQRLLEAVQAIAGDNPETISVFQTFAGPECLNPEVRLAALVHLHAWAGDEADRRTTVAPLVIAALPHAPYQPTCIDIAAGYGPLCKPVLSLLKQLKLSPDANTRAAATRAVAAIEKAD